MTLKHRSVSGSFMFSGVFDFKSKFLTPNLKLEKLVLRLRDEGESYRGIREQTGLGLATIRRIIADRDALLEQSEQVEALRK